MNADPKVCVLFGFHGVVHPFYITAQNRHFKTNGSYDGFSPTVEASKISDAELIDYGVHDTFRWMLDFLKKQKVCVGITVTQPLEKYDSTMVWINREISDVLGRDKVTVHMLNKLDQDEFYEFKRKAYLECLKRDFDHSFFVDTDPLTALRLATEFDGTNEHIVLLKREFTSKFKLDVLNYEEMIDFFGNEIVLPVIIKQLPEDQDGFLQLITHVEKVVYSKVEAI